MRAFSTDRLAPPSTYARTYQGGAVRGVTYEKYVHLSWTKRYPDSRTQEGRRGNRVMQAVQLDSGATCLAAVPDLNIAVTMKDHV